MVGVSGLEPPASSSRTKRASHCATPRCCRGRQQFSLYPTCVRIAWPCISNTGQQRPQPPRPACGRGNFRNSDIYGHLRTFRQGTFFDFPLISSYSLPFSLGRPVVCLNWDSLDFDDSHDSLRHDALKPQRAGTAPEIRLAGYPGREVMLHSYYDREVFPELGRGKCQ